MATPTYPEIPTFFAYSKLVAYAVSNANFNTTTNLHIIGGKLVFFTGQVLFCLINFPTGVNPPCEFVVPYTDIDDVLLAFAPVANLLVEHFRVQGDVAKPNVDPAAVDAAKAARVADPVRIGPHEATFCRILRYRNGEFRPLALHTPSPTVSERPPEHYTIIPTYSASN
ncbi:hypothetical protein DAPPUDRAFT_334999 [Daphnia pulex]|uniref:Uncharacterized protein n=1 Tax=Daphnia pulex TaxID=6669 RepID=E9HWV3_DAPPU|nr:hypothetical protein DAPPUDRAFT_334999 [Daphnia pulex]|eukprot:EFX63767.1 hypothetical protein DAPPUDRAFT_334999 [Daphnia pulex]